ncbi:MAG: gamma-glutamyl-gamma-aminobutyrate hydrolase family protein, partial [Myxococcota bacterium]
RTSALEHTGEGLFRGVEQGVEVGRYHSLVIEPETLPDELVVDAWSDGFIMAVRHRELPTYGVQFHPESVLTPAGYEILRSFIKRCFR